jgi:glutamine synthetase adenylyltransferase
VTRDVRTIPPLLVLLAQVGTSHGGVIFVDHRAIPEGNTGALVRALLALWQEEGGTDWTDRVAYLRPGNPSRETRAGQGHYEA